jgi:ABC-type nickel/cobalt efflux system permease component RcnA
MIWLGALSALIMSLGMGFTIAISAALGTALRRKSATNGEKYLKIIDILGVLVMFLAGIFLILAV